MSDFLARISHFSAKRLALLADELNDRVRSLERSRSEPVAIVGIGCRFPGGADSPEKYWQLLRDGVDAVTEVPPYRWDIDRFYDPDPDAPGKMSTRWGGFVGPVDGFDAHFFGISPREAASLDPQQRLLLETTWRALEDAGISPHRLEGSRTAVYLGMSAGDYFQTLHDAGPESFDAYTASGTAHSIASGRISYTLGLRGPSVSIDTACSSSLVAIHQAVHSLRRRESDVALAGGVNLVLRPDITIALSKSHMMAPDGRCKAFDARADGFVRGEGCGILVLKRLGDALADGDRVVAVIRGSAANQDGRSNGLTAPSGPAQEAVLRDALADAGCDPHHIDFVEAHGTGTSLGDPIEVQALQSVLGAGRPAGAPLRIGSVKSSIGHLEAAAGVAGVIKAALALWHGQIPGQLHVQRLNPYIPWSDLAIEVPTRLCEWPAAGRPRLAGVSSFGFSGTNVHLVIEQAPAGQPAPPAACRDRVCHLVPVSARDDEGLRSQATQLAEAIERGGAPIPDIAHTLSAGRAHFGHRLAVAVTDRSELVRQLAAAGRGEAVEGARVGIAGSPPKVAFLFTGQGAQYVGMARGLYESEPVFRDAIDRCDAGLNGLLPVPLLDVLFPPGEASSPIDDTAFTQPALFSIEYALATLWMSWGVRPTVVAGHSVGEFAAACIAGVFTLEDGLRLIAARGRLMGALPRDGAMAAMQADAQWVLQLLSEIDGTLGIAAVNGPRSVVVSGDAAAVDLAVRRAEERGVRTTRLNVSHAFHSPLMAPMLDAFEQVARDVRMSPPRIDLVSNVTGRPADVRITTPEYWCRHVLEPVRFADSLRVLVERQIGALIEIGPHPTLLGMAAECEGLEDVVSLPSLRRGRDDERQIADSLAALYVRGAAVDWAAMDAGRGRGRVVLPGYPFRRERFWIDPEPAAGRGESSLVSVAPVVHPLLGHPVEQSISDDRLYAARPSVSGLPWLADHRIHDRVLMPSPGWIEMALKATALALGDGPICIEGLAFQQVLDIDEGETARVQTVVSMPRDGEVTWRISSAADAGWRGHASGRGRRSDAVAPLVDSATLRDFGGETVELGDYYAWLERLGFVFGERFRGARVVHRREGDALARMVWPEGLSGGPDEWMLHPAILDGCLHMVGAALPRSARTLSEGFMLFGVDRVDWFAAPGRSFWADVRIRDGASLDVANDETFRADMTLFDDQGVAVVVFSGMQFKRARQASLGAQLPDRVRRMLHEVAWRKMAPVGAMASPDDVAATVLPGIASLATANGLDDYARFFPALDALARDCVVRALKALGFSFETGARFDARALASRLGVTDRHERLFGRLLAILAEDGILARSGDAWQVCAPPPDTDVVATHDLLAARHPDCRAELSLTLRCGLALADVLAGRVDPLPLLFPDGSSRDLEQLYQHSPPARAYNALLAKSVERLLAEWPKDRKLRILEIGGGTGSTTAYLLPCLQRLGLAQVDYCFTDVSPLFGARVREKFPQARVLRTEVLDIARDPAPQGFSARSFDLVVAANVLHATPDLAATLARVRSLMDSDARLLLLEGATPQRFGDLTVGLLEGWWNHEDAHRRAYALMPRPAWLSLLSETGFADARALPADDAGPVLRQQAVYVAGAPGDRQGLPADWLVCPDSQGVAHAVADLLRADGDRVEFLVGDEGARRALVARPWDGIVHLSALDASVDGSGRGDAVVAQQSRLIGGALGLVQQLLAARDGRTPRLWFVTRGAQSVRDAEPAEPSQATVWGFAHTVALEHPELGCRRLDLDPGADARECAAWLRDQLRSETAEDQIAMRDRTAWVRRIVRRPGTGALPRVPVRGDRSYLITGGLRGLGLSVARWLVEQGARHVALLGRRCPDDLAREAMAVMSGLGATIHAVEADVGDAAAMKGVFERLQGCAPPLAGIVHSAGALDDGVIGSLDWSRFDAVMRAKVAGAWNLHALAGDLEWLVLFSSGASLAGSPGQANHAAANAFEDALAHFRQAKGLPTVSINWGPWADIGAAAERHVKAVGMGTIAPADGLLALDHAMRIERPGATFGVAQVAVLPTDWTHLGEAAEAGRLAPMFAELVMFRPRETRADVPAKAPEHSLGDRIREAMPNRRRNVLRDFVRDEAARVLGLGAASKLDINEPLRQLGLDSLMAVELRNRLGKAVGRGLPATVTFDHPTVVALVQYLSSTVFGDEFNTASGARPSDGAGASGPAQVAPQPVPAAQSEVALDDLSQDELALRLASRLDAIALQEKS